MHGVKQGCILKEEKANTQQVKNFEWHCNLNEEGMQNNSTARKCIQRWQQIPPKSFLLADDG